MRERLNLKTPKVRIENLVKSVENSIGSDSNGA